MIAAGVFVVAGAIGFVRGRAVPAATAAPMPVSTTTSRAGTSVAAPSGGAPARNDEAKPSAMSRTFPWGDGPGRIGLPEEDEAHAENPLRLAAGADGVVMLDDENHRLVRMGHDGSTRSDVRLATRARVRDIAVAKDGSFVALEGDGTGSRVALFTKDGAARGTLPVAPEVAAKSRSVVVSGKDVFVESIHGQITRIGDVAGTADPDAKEVPGIPLRDGRGWLTARITSARKGTLHVYVVERDAGEAQRFSREIRPGLFVDGIPLVDSDASGTIYVIVTGRGDGEDNERAKLLCIESERGDVVGSVDLAVRIGPEAILDGKALDSGGVVFSVFTKEGMRVERHACP